MTAPRRGESTRSYPEGFAHTETVWGEWRYRATFEIVESSRGRRRVALTSLFIEPAGAEPVALTTAAMRVPLKQFSQEVRDLPLIGKLQARRLPPRQRTYDDWREVARVYNAAVEAGDNPKEAVESEFDISYPLAGKWVSIARNEHKLIPPWPEVRGRLREIRQAKGASE